MSGKRRNIDSDFEAKNHQLQFHGSLNRAAAKGRGRQMFRSPIPKIFSSVCARWTRISRGVTGSAPVSSMEALKSPDRSTGAFEEASIATTQEVQRPLLNSGRIYSYASTVRCPCPHASILPKRRILAPFRKAPDQAPALQADQVLRRSSGSR